MALTVTYDHPDFEDEFGFYMEGIGTLPNRKGVEVSEEAERAFYAFHGQSISDAFADSESVKVSGSASVTDHPEAVEVSDTPPADPTVENIDPETGEVFTEANLTGSVSEPDFTPVETPANQAETTTSDTITHVPEGKVIGGGE